MKKRIITFAAALAGMAFLAPPTQGHAQSLYVVQAQMARSKYLHFYRPLYLQSRHHAQHSATPRPSQRNAPAAPQAPAVYDNSPTGAIAAAAARWGVSYAWLLRVAQCESGLNPSAENPSGASGLFQFMPGTYWLYAARIGETRSYWSSAGSANVAAYMFSIGLSYQWTCSA